MKIIYIKLVNFIGVNAAMGLKELELSFDKIDKPIIQIYGRNRCGKTVLIQQLHPFSSINLNGDERSDLSLILTGEVGIKNIVYEDNGDIYNITHTYKPTPNGNHTISSSFKCNNEELNPSGGVTLFNNLVEKVMGINKYVFQFVINGTQLTSFSNMSSTQRKNLLNKAMGIDIYDKIHKMATDDYRYTNKLITSLNNSKEYLLSTYGSYDNLCSLLKQRQDEHDTISKSLESMKSRLDSLSGKISVIKNQNVSQELMSVERIFSVYKNVVDTIGDFDNKTYDRLVDEQISLNNDISSLKNEKLLIMKDIDVLHSKKTNIENIIMANRKASMDYNNMVSLMNDLKNKINNIKIEIEVSSSSSYLMSMLSVGQAVNGICKEIVTCLNDKHFVMFASMIEKGIDISAFLIQEGSVLMDTEKEKTVVSRIRNMINNIDGEYVDDCCHNGCIYKKTHDLLETYFKSYQSATSSKFTQYDIEQFDHAYKNVQTIKRLINLEISDELKNMFNIITIMGNLVDGQLGIDTNHIQYLIEEAAKIELRNKYISQLGDVEKSVESMKSLMLSNSDDHNETLQTISDEINKLNISLNDIGDRINELTNKLSVNDNKRMMLSQVQHIDINDTQIRYQKLKSLNDELVLSEHEFSQLTIEYNDILSKMNVLDTELKSLKDSYNQYNNTVSEINKYKGYDSKYKIIAEATSSTKGKPVVAIKDEVEDALLMTNRLLDVMYEGEIEMLQPTIDENEFSLPFRCGSNISPDVRYGSQSEQMVLSLVMSLALASSLSPYNVFLLDECDGYLDMEVSDKFVYMINTMMDVLKVEQTFIISHHVEKSTNNQIVYQLDLTDIINN